MFKKQPSDSIKLKNILNVANENNLKYFKIIFKKLKISTHFRNV